jgi:hypothetical protein
MLPLLLSLSLEDDAVKSPSPPRPGPLLVQRLILMPALACVECIHPRVLHTITHCTEVGRPPVQITMKRAQVQGDARTWLPLKGCTSGWLSLGAAAPQEASWKHGHLRAVR